MYLRSQASGLLSVQDPKEGETQQGEMVSVRTDSTGLAKCEWRLNAGDPLQTVEAYWEDSELKPAIRAVPLPAAPAPKSGQPAAPAAPAAPVTPAPPAKKSAGC